MYDIDRESTFNVKFWGEQERPDLMSVRFLDVTGQILGEVWVSGGDIEPDNYENLVLALQDGLAVVGQMLAKQEMSQVVSPAQLREVFVASSLALIIDACIIAGLREEKKPPFAEDLVVTDWEK